MDAIMLGEELQKETRKIILRRGKQWQIWSLAPLYGSDCILRNSQVQGSHDIIALVI